MSVSRRRFLSTAPVAIAPALWSSSSFQAPGPSATAQGGTSSPLPATFPTQAPELAREMVGVSHANLPSEGFPRCIRRWRLVDWFGTETLRPHRTSAIVIADLPIGTARPTIFQRQCRATGCREGVHCGLAQHRDDTAHTASRCFAMRRRRPARTGSGQLLATLLAPTSVPQRSRSQRRDDRPRWRSVLRLGCGRAHHHRATSGLTIRSPTGHNGSQSGAPRRPCLLSGRCDA